MIGNVSLNTKRNVSMPMIAMRGVVMFPNTLHHFDVSRPKSIASLERVLKTGEPIFLVCQREIADEDPAFEDLYTYGIVCDVKQVLRLHDDVLKVLVNCVYRARLNDVYMEDGVQMASVTRSTVRRISEEDTEAAEALVRSIKEQVIIYLNYMPKAAADIAEAVSGEMRPEDMTEFLAFNLPLDYQDKQMVLEEGNALKRMHLLLGIIAHENSVLEIEQEINSKVQESLAQNQRDYYLREQMNIISRELGDGEDTDTTADGYREKIESLPLGEEHKHKLLKEVKRLRNNVSNSQEYAVIDQYLDTVTRLPWGVYTEDNYDIKNAKEILDRDHYGLKDVKNRILEYMAVRARTDHINGQIICLVGPPGVGKTSIAKSLAEAMNRKFVRMSLGGVKDEAEIRGHRRTYVASMPGRIISSIQLAGTCNPLILMDEIDKLSSDYKGDPASALLEVLDPEQNVSFEDHYLDIPFDLSQVFFLTTANDMGAIPSALRDRMDIIELSSYTATEKFHIAKDHLMPKQMFRNGLEKKDFSVSDKALEAVIDDYTSEAGVRNLERTLAKLMRKAAREISETGAKKVKVTAKNLEEYLGPAIVKNDISSKKDMVGVANGMAWTSVGGVLLPIEATVIPGTGKLLITGSLGEVMTESAKLAITFARTLGPEYKVPEKLMTEFDIHIHAPEGAVPKDGPSAGVTMATALVSAASGMKVRHDLAMTGEITLQGRVLAIGGLKEKLIAAYKNRMTKVLIPKANVSDLREVPDEVRQALEIVPVEQIEDVLKAALVE